MNPVEIRYLLEAIHGSKYKPNNYEKKFLKKCKKISEKGNYINYNQGDFLKTIYRKTQDNRGYQKRGYV